MKTHTPWKTLITAATVMLLLIIPLAILGLGLVAALVFRVIKLAIE